MSVICDDLRAAILQAAMQGKLTEQLPEDGNASELLENISNYRKLSNNKCKPTSPVDNNELSVEVPSNWAAVRLSDVFDCIMGSSPAGESVTRNAEGGLEFHQGKIHFGEKYIRFSGDYTNAPSRIADANTALLCVRAPIGKVNITDRQLCIGRGLACIKPLCGVTVDYLYYLLLSLEKAFVKQGTGSTFKAISKDVVLNQPFLLPPLAEQKRIVEKVDELMARVADLEKSADALASLKKAFPSDIKTALLQAAIQGKLTKQLPEDGDAADLLEQIKAEKEKLIAEGKIKKQKALAPIADDEFLSIIPANWIWVRLGNLVSVLGGKRIPAGKKLVGEDTGHVYIRVSDMRNGTVTIDNLLFVPEDVYQGIKRYIINKEDVYITVAGTIGRVGKIPSELDGANLTENADRLVFRGLNQDWLIRCLESPVVQQQIFEATTQVGQPKLAIKRIEELLIPLPPLAEQKRIVERLDALMQNIEVVGDLIAAGE